MAIIAKFIAEAWIGDYAVETGLEVEFDVTEQVLEMGREKALALRDDQYETDDLWWANPISDSHPWSGPFRVEVRDAIHDYYEQETARQPFQQEFHYGL